MAEIDDQVKDLKARLQKARPPKRGDNSRGQLALDAWRAGEEFIVLRGGWKLNGERVQDGGVVSLAGLNADFVRALADNGQVATKAEVDAAASYKAMLDAFNGQVEPLTERLAAVRTKADKAQAYKAQAERQLAESLRMISDATGEVRQAEDQLAAVLASEPVIMAFTD